MAARPAVSDVLMSPLPSAIVRQGIKHRGCQKTETIENYLRWNYLKRAEEQITESA